MKFRDIAKMHAYNVGLKNDITEGDMNHYLDQLDDDAGVTPGRLAKANEALDTLRESLAGKWNLSKAFRKAPHPVVKAPPSSDD